MAPPDFPVVGLGLALKATGLVVVCYLFTGFAYDVNRRRRQAVRNRMQDDLATVLFRSEKEAAAAAERLADAPRSAVFDLVQRLAAARC